MEAKQELYQHVIKLECMSWTTGKKGHLQHKCIHKELRRGVFSHQTIYIKNYEEAFSLIERRIGKWRQRQSIRHYIRMYELEFR